MKKDARKRIESGDTIIHPTWGVGIVTATNGSGFKRCLQVLFENSFYKILSACSAERNCEIKEKEEKYEQRLL